MSVEHVNYGEQYPQCANCPKLALAQKSRDSLTETYEHTEVAAQLRRAESEHNHEQLDNRYLDFLDRINSYSIPEDDFRITEAHVLYGIYDDNNDAKHKAEDRENALADDMVRSLVNLLYDRPIAKLTSHCVEGPRDISILGKRGVFCRSEVKRLIDIMPPPPKND